MKLTTGNRPNRVAMNKAIGIFLEEIMPYIVSEIEMVVGKPIESAAIDVLGDKVGSRFLEDLGIGQSERVPRHLALTRISLTVEFFWPIYKKRLRNRKVTSGALRQIEYSAVTSADRGVDLEELYVEQRMDDIIDILGKIEAIEAREEVERLKTSIRLG